MDAYAEATKHLYDIYCAFSNNPHVRTQEDSNVRGALEKIDGTNARIIAQDEHSDHKIRAQTFINNY